MANIDSLAALADPTRRKVFEAVAQGAGPVSAISEGLPVTRSAVSQHLKVLEEAGLVTSTPSGNMRIYAIRKEGLQELRDYLDQFWSDVLTNFAEEINTKDH